MTSGITSRMTSRIDSFLIIFSLLYILGSSVAIYDPSATTVKPSKRQDLPRPWYLTGEDYPGRSENLEPLRSSNWQISPDEARPRKPIANLDTVTWTPWRKNAGSEIEQRTEIVGDQQTETNFDQTRDFTLTYDQYEQRESNKLHEKFNPGVHVQGTQDRNRLNTQNPWENANPPNGDKFQMETENDRELYEGISIDNAKPHKGKILVSSKPQPTVAQYDPQLGVQCPTTESTGQFVYPPDCKSFVNCWKGRAFVQRCAPGTLFNPNTLECDFPHKVECYGENFPPKDNSNSFERLKSPSDSSVSFGTNRSQIPKCPSHVTGLLPHPLECNKFLQCANGETFIMDCGPGTVFNPTISVCDWPRNVRGCEDVFKSEEENESPSIPPNPSHQEKLDYKKQQFVKKISCPPDYTGLLPHPENCKKFLQCANGITYVMDCGPGTAFNPLTSVCDWPHKVPGCSNDSYLDKRVSTQLPSNVVTTAKPWSSRNPKDSRPLEHPRRYNHSWIGDREQGSWILGQTSHPTTTNQPEVEWNSRLRPTWRPNWNPNSWTTIRPIYDSKLQGQYDRTGSNTDYPRESDRHRDLSGKAAEHHKTVDRDHDSYPGQWQPGHGANNKNHVQNNEENIRNQYHHHHNHHPYSPSPHRSQTHHIEQETVNENLHPVQSESFGHSTGYNHHRHPNYPRESPDYSEIGAPLKFDEPTVGFNEEGVQPNEKLDPKLTSNRGQHDRIDSEYPDSVYDQSAAPDGNIYVNSDYEFTMPGHPNPTKAPSIWRWESKNKISNTQSGHFGVNPNKWNQDEPPFPVYYVPPVEPLSHSKNSARLTPTSGQVIRLRGGSGPTDGYVEVQGINPGWGIVCDSRNSWTLKEAHVVCKQLGYTRGAEMAWQGRTNRNGMPTWIAANSVTCHGNETRFQSCKFTHEHECRVERDAIGVRCAPNRLAHCRKDEIPYEGQCYHLADPDSGLNHAEALDYCVQRQARLIDITTQLENDFVSEWLLQLHPEVGSIMTSGVGFTTFNRTLWLWEDSSRAKFRFTKWWPGWLEDKKQPPWVGSRPACVIMKRKFPCHERPDTICVADYFFWDTEDCASSTKGHAYICKRPYDDIGCIYGKGNLYAGNANVTASGKNCVSWGDEEVAHPLLVNVVNRDVRDKLKTHNYCRNPNPNKESRPWCFTGPYGEREYCDIPPCGNMGSKKSLLTGQCKPKHFECLPGECIPSPWVCDGEEDCTNGADERTCTTHLNLFQKMARHRLEGYDVEKWLNTPLKTCALRCKEADFTCRSFTHKADGNVCLLSDSNIGMTGALKPSKEYDYYEMKERSINCDGMYICGNRKCINQTQVCNGKNDCNDRTDESICTIENLDYAIRLAGSENNYEGRIEVKILGVWGQVCDDGFGMIDADVICKELGFALGAFEVRPGGFYGNIDPPTRFMVDQLQCRGNETSLRECDFDGWGVHNCQPEEAVGVVCKTAVDTCQEGHWKCDNSPVCIPTPFICDEVSDCPDGSDESVEHCKAPFETRLVNGSSQFQGRVEVRHHGIWGTVCDDDFSNATAAVICRSLGYGGIAIAKKDGFFGAGTGPIWLDEVFCHGNESQLNQCEHNHWGQHNCDHTEDAGVICTPGDINNSELFWETVAEVPQVNVNHLLPADCGKRSKDFNDDEDFIFAKVVHGSVAPKGTYPWQASIRVRGHSRSSHWCGAVVISPLHVLTAAHCLEGYNKGTYFVRAGDYNTEIDEGTEVEANIEDYYIHEDFRKGHRMNNDIALVLLKGRGIPLGKDIMPICLPAENTEYSAGLNCTISGFGSIETGKSTHSKDLRYGWIPLLDQSVCRAGYIYGEGAISDGMVCAGYLDEGVDTCDGDSGGPLACFHNGVFSLYGITSWGQHCGKANKPGVYVRVSHYRRWIDQKIQESVAGR